MTRAFVALVVAATLAGCSGGGDFKDLQGFMDEVNARPRGSIEPLPPFLRVPPFAYQAGSMRSPFDPPVVVKRVERNPEGPKVTPDVNRSKEYLEQFAIGNLEMVGTLSQRNSLFGLVRDKEGGVHRVQRGDYMGTDHGRISRISEASIDLIEIVPDGVGGWVERERTVSLGTQRG
jgi:type IV pilus assembly protein PilP